MGQVVSHVLMKGYTFNRRAKGQHNTKTKGGDPVDLANNSASVIRFLIRVSKWDYHVLRHLEKSTGEYFMVQLI